ncbi:MAG TPA: hypothetical protein VED20_05460 [Streptosporangiaceae bacterium]|nr:hypothetical protein [Streptosporangiaceae bacterium]
MRSTWPSAVRCEITSSAAICLLLRPPATSRATSNSRCVSSPPAGMAGARGCFCGLAGGCFGGCRA